MVFAQTGNIVDASAGRVDLDDQDRMVPLETSYKMAEALPQCTFAELHDCGHFMHVEQPRQVAGVLASFLENYRSN